MAVLLEDTFTAVDGTLLGSHIGETNALWVSNADFGSGNGDADEFVIKSNRMRRPTFGDPFGYVGGTPIAYSATSPDLDALDHVDIGFDVMFDVTTTNSYVGMYFNAQDTVGAPTLMFELSHNGTSGAMFIPGYGSFPVTMSLGSTHAVRVLIRGDNLVYIVGSVMVRAVTAVAPVGKMGIVMFDFNGESRVSVDNLLVSSVETVAYYDDFTGTGTLDSYASDSGANYLAASGSPLSSVVREGGGYITTLSSTDTRHSIADIPLGVGLSRVEFISERVTSAGTGVWLVGVRLLTPGSVAPVSDPTFGVNVRYLGGTTELFVYNGDGTVTTGVNPIAGTPSPLTDFPCYVVVEFDSGTQEIVVQFNGAEIHRAIIPVIDTASWRPVVTIRSAAASDTRLHYAGVITANPFAPQAFWINRIRTAEII